MGLFDEAKKLAREHADKVETVLDKAEEAVDQRTTGKTNDLLGKGLDAARKAVDDRPAR